MRIPLDELKARVSLYYTPEELVEALNMEPEILIDLLEEVIWERGEALMDQMGVTEELDGDNEE